MKLLKQQRNELVEGILPMLKEGVEQTQRQKKMEGRELIYQGITKDKDGKQIEPGVEYVYFDTVQVKVNHRRRILEIIDRAKNETAMREDLARYLAKYGKSLEVISEGIPQHLRTNK